MLRCGLLFHVNLVKKFNRQKCEHTRTACLLGSQGAGLGTQWTSCIMKNEKLSKNKGSSFRRITLPSRILCYACRRSGHEAKQCLTENAVGQLRQQSYGEATANHKKIEVEDNSSCQKDSFRKTKTRYHGGRWSLGREWSFSQRQCKYLSTRQKSTAAFPEGSARYPTRKRQNRQRGSWLTEAALFRGPRLP